jgi:hypothetical protein
LLIDAGQENQKQSGLVLFAWNKIVTYSRSSSLVKMR